MSKVPRSGDPESLVHWTLLWGVAASGMLLCMGIVITLLKREARPEGLPPGFATLVYEAVKGSGMAILDLGLLLLMLTPLLRVIVLATAWIIKGERMFSVIAVTVLGLLVLSFVLGVG